MTTPSPAELDLECLAGSDFELEFSMDDPDGQPISFAGCQAWLTVYDDQEKTVEVLKLSKDGGEIVFQDADISIVARYPASLTAALPVDGHIYDLDVEFSNGVRWRVFTGRFEVQAGNYAS
ncbi:MAG: hypothetical protein V7727_22020 [Sneathiella sp.]